MVYLWPLPVPGAERQLELDPLIPIGRLHPMGVEVVPAPRYPLEPLIGYMPLPIP